ncbi:helix-turn-helix domain-containing protein [Clostridium gasigenes]|uniref:helix-turn-helix domain-containing protein n=1 Tax=Clostridium gasigenes TaxID=94869 RepID=UPI001C0E22DC|nr:helix-turn-helix transcriptional regulator [Clostridium gasigenes]MBU3107118.1 helix-turn-helix domain-containing protein [Clostridium gasigenes]
MESFKTNQTPGIKLKTLRLKSNLTVKELSYLINISSKTLNGIENDNIHNPYYWHKICNVFNTNANVFLDLYDMPENTLEDKLIKIRALLGSLSWKEVSLSLDISEYAISEFKKGKTKSNLNRYLLLIDEKLEELMNS